MTRLVSVWAELAVALRCPGHLEHCLHRRVPVTGVFGLSGVDMKIVDMKITATRCLAYGATAVKVLDIANGSSLAKAFGTQGALQSLLGWEIPSRCDMGGSRSAEDNARANIIKHLIPFALASLVFGLKCSQNTCPSAQYHTL